MPTPPTNVPSKTARDAAAPCLELAIAAATDTPGGALAATAPDVSVAALRKAFSEKQAVGPPASSRRRVLDLLRRYWRAFQARRQRERLRVSLHDLSERELMDIGVTSGDIDCIAAGRAIERLRDGITHPWLSRGVM